MRKFNIPPLNHEREAMLRHKIDFKTKPLGALGELEKIAIQIGLIQNTLTPVLNRPTIVVFAGDHGIAEEGVSAYPQEVTFQMVMNFLNEGAAINIFCKQNAIDLKIVDAGVKYDFPKKLLTLIDRKISKGTKNFLKEPAMSVAQAENCIDQGAKICVGLFENGCDVIGFGEMGIGNTTSASAVLASITELPIEQCVGKGTGIDEMGRLHKIEIIQRAIALYPTTDTPLKILATFGGFEIAQMTGAMLQAAELKMVILVDGFISTCAFLIAQQLKPAIIQYAIFTHKSEEQGHQLMFEFLGVKPLLNLNMRLGEGTGVAVAYPIIKSAVAFLNDMASFESAGVSNKEEKELV